MFIDVRVNVNEMVPVFQTCISDIVLIFEPNLSCELPLIITVWKEMSFNLQIEDE